MSVVGEDNKLNLSTQGKPLDMKLLRGEIIKLYPEIFQIA